MNSKKLFVELALKIHLTESADEINQLVFLLMEHVFGLSSTEILTGREVLWDTGHQEKMFALIHRLNQHEPIHYILGEAWFYGRKFTVNPAVLIPRPETEELIETALTVLPNNREQAAHILDIGTGSGCIPITLKLERHAVSVYATDISEEALRVARLNARNLRAHVEFLRHDILTETIPFTGLDLIVSNPPYITYAERWAMQANVLEHEPHTALFATGDDPLIFYKNIARKAKIALKPGGHVVVEINEKFGDETAAVFDAEKYADITLRKDIAGKDRIVTATWFTR
jgi:release factor glutamine methyltransferase